MTVHTNAGTTFSISAATPATFDAAGYGALTYTEVGEVTSIGDVGGTYNIVTHSPLSTRIVQKLKGTLDMGDNTVEFASFATDAGQVLMRTASNSDSNYSVRIVEQDGTENYFRAIFTSFKKKYGTSDNIVAGTVNMAINTLIVEA